jgi:hypothetical protein
MFLSRNFQNNVKSLLRTLMAKESSGARHMKMKHVITEYLQQRRKRHVKLESFLPALGRSHGGFIFSECCELDIRPAGEEVGFIPLALPVAAIQK